MTTGSYQLGGGQPPFELNAQETLAAMQRHAAGPQPYRRPLTDEERQEAEEAARQAERVCRLCTAIHPLPNSPGCPRLATFKLDGDGRVVEGTFWEGTAWAKGRVVLLEDAHEDGEEGGDGER